MKIRVGSDEYGTEYDVTHIAGVGYWHEPCDKWLGRFDGDGGNEDTWMTHVCPGITAGSILHPERARWRALANEVRAHIARVTGE